MKLTVTSLMFGVLALAGCTHQTKEPLLEDCRKIAVVTGYWPNTNEMLREWSANPELNRGEWAGRNWGDHGYDVYAFFPEFPPDGNPMNDPFGSIGWVGSKESDLQVDYQDTTTDFWRIMDEYQPHVLITTSRGGDIGWEVEALEGGHDGGSEDPAEDWLADEHGEATLPTRATLDPRSWQAISSYRAGRTLSSQLPMEKIVNAARALDLVSVEIDRTETSGNYLSGFIALHGLYYNKISAHNVAAGHIHVGIEVTADDARALMHTTLDTVLHQLDANKLSCH